MAITDTLFKELAKNSVLLLSLHGVRTVLERELGIKNLQISADETIKAEIERKVQQHGKVDYPYAFMSMSELIGVRDQSNNKHAQRFGIRMGAAGATLATSRKAFLFPINIGLELRYIDDDPMRAMVMAETMVILSMIGGLTFNLKLSEAINFDVRVEIPETVPIPLASTTNTEAPGGIEVTLSLIIHTFSGFFKEVSAVNSSSPTISMEIEMEDEIIKTEL